MSESLFVHAAPDDAGELLTLQRAAYVDEARLYGTWDLPPLVETLEALTAAIEHAAVLKTVRGIRMSAR